MEFFLSPDFRFLSKELLDSTLDPVLEERHKREILAAGLLNGHFASQGAKGAPVTITVFSDFQCPYCARLARMLKTDIFATEGKTTRLVFRHFPLSMHNWARPAAEATACVQEQGDGYFWTIHDFLFEHQQELGPDNILSRIREEAKQLHGFNSSRLERCVTSKQTAREIDRDIAFGTENGVSVTPTLFINAERVSGVVAPEQLRTLIKEARAQATKIEASSR